MPWMENGTRLPQRRDAAVREAVGPVATARRAEQPIRTEDGGPHFPVVAGNVRRPGGHHVPSRSSPAGVETPNHRLATRGPDGEQDGNDNGPDASPVDSHPDVQAQRKE